MILSDFKSRFLAELSKYNEYHDIAFIMDGNRRYAKLIETKNENSGHLAGSITLKKVISWCNLASLKNIGAFAFSIENFKRSDAEVDFLMNLAQSQLEEIAEYSRSSNSNYNLKIIGDVNMLPVGPKASVNKVNSKVSNNTGNNVLIYGPYTGTWEIFRSDEKWSPQIVVRTSGENRLSDFLTYQVLNLLI